MEVNKNVFISHHRKDDKNIEKFRNLLKKRGYQIKNSSIDSSKPNNANNEDYVKSILRSKIQWAGTFICLIGTQTSKREWVNWEIKQAAKQGKKIIGVYLDGAKGEDIPENLNLYGDSLVTWRSEKIIAAIEGKLKGEEKWCDSDGNPREPVFNAGRSFC